MPDIWLSRHASGLSLNQRPFTAGPCSKSDRSAISTKWPYPESGWSLGARSGPAGLQRRQLALYPPAGLARKLALPDSLADDPHVIVCYSGNAADMSFRKLPAMSQKSVAARTETTATRSPSPPGRHAFPPIGARGGLVLWLTAPVPAD
jgi:hypothetical protein